MPDIKYKMNCIGLKQNTQSEVFSKHNLVPFVATYPVYTCAWRSTDAMFLPLCCAVFSSVEQAILVICQYTGQWMTWDDVVKACEQFLCETFHV